MRSRQVAVVSMAAALATASAVVLLLVPVLSVGARPRDVVGLMSNVLQVAAPVLAAVVCVDSARRQPTRRRRVAWWLMGAGTGGWAVGQALYAWIEEVQGREVPVPSLADAGFLLFPLLASVGAMYLPVRPLTRAVAVRYVLDGLMIAAALLTVSWITSVSTIWRAGAADLAALVVTSSYPISDVMLLTVVLLLIVRGDRIRRRMLVPLASGLGCFAVADTGYVLATSAGTYTSGAVFDLGWILGFLLIAVAAVLDRPRAADSGSPREDPLGGRVSSSLQSWLGILVPYLVVLVAGAVMVVRLRGQEAASLTDTALSAVLVLVVVGRQFVALVDNRALVVQLHVERELARHQALHDALTGLPNRTLFWDRVTHAIELDRRTTSAISVLFCDLDDFKRVNDEHGHDVGDHVLVEVSRRMLSELRDGDTLARLGGDEFAVLLERSDDAPAVAERLAQVVRAPLQVGRRTLHLSISVGVATTDDAAVPVADDLIRRADRAMYVAKAGTPGRVRLRSSPP